MESLAIAYVLKCKLEQMGSLSPDMVSEKEHLQKDIGVLQELYTDSLENC